MTSKPSTLKLVVLDIGAPVISTSIFYAYDLLKWEVSLAVIVALGGYFAWRRHYIGH